MSEAIIPLTVVFFLSDLDEQQAESRGLPEAAGEGESPPAASEHREPAQSGDRIGQKTQPGERM